MEIEPLLLYRRAGEHEGPERAVERRPDGVLADVLAVVRAAVADPLPEQVPLFVEHRLQVALPAVVQHEPPVGRLVARGRGPGGELAQQRDDGRPVEEAPVNA